MSDQSGGTSASSEPHRPDDLSINKTPSPAAAPAGLQFVDTSEAGSSAERVSFVANQLNELVRSSSPIVSADSPSVATVGFLSSSVLPSPYPPLVPDAQCLIDLETQAGTIAQNLDRLLLELKGTLHGMTALTADNVLAYTNNVSRTCDTVDNSIKAMYQMMAKVEEISSKLAHLPHLAQQIRDIKRVLDLFEMHLQKSAGY